MLVGGQIFKSAKERAGWVGDRGKLRPCNLGKAVVVLGDLFPNPEWEAPLHLCNKNDTVSIH